MHEIEQRPALRISHIVYGREAAGNRVTYRVDSRGNGVNLIRPTSWPKSLVRLKFLAKFPDMRGKFPFPLHRGRLPHLCLRIQTYCCNAVN